MYKRQSEGGGGGGAARGRDAVELGLEEAEQACNEVLKTHPKNAKAHYRKAQVHMLRLDLDRAQECLDAAAKLPEYENSAAARELDRKLRALRREERARARELYGGLRRPQATYAAAAAAARHARWRGRAVGAARAVALPVVVPLRWLGRLLDASVWQPLCAAAEWVAERAAARVEHTMGLHHVRAREAAHHANKKYD